MNSPKWFGTVVCAIFVSAAISPLALGQNVPPADRLLASNAQDSPSSFLATPVDQSQSADCYGVGFGKLCCPRWTASADFIILDRIGGVGQTLVETVSGTVSLHDLHHTPGTELLSGNDFQQGFAGGPRIGLIRHGDNGCDFELSYFQIDGWSSERSVGPDPADWLIMRCPGVFLQTQQIKETQVMAWDYATRLYNAELNARWNPCRQVTLLAGFRWIELRENLQGALEPPSISWEPPFWNTTTENNLYGFQIGADGKIFESGRFSLDGLVKAGVFDNNADETTGVSVYKVVRPSSAWSKHASFVGEAGLQCNYQLAKSLVLKAGYEALWLQGVALAPGQIEETYMPRPKTAIAAGVNCDSSVFYHGATAGLEYSF